MNELDDIHTVLEIGPYKLPFVKGSDIIDLYPAYKKDYPFEIGEFIQYDCSKTPLPFEDKQYDLVIACQVIEHFGYTGQQVEFFKELERICNKAIVSLPFLWHKPSLRGHHMIDRKMIYEWTGKRKPSSELISGKKNHLRILQLYEFDKEIEDDKTYIRPAKKEDIKILSKRFNMDIDELLEQNSKLKNENKKLEAQNNSLNKENRKLNNQNNNLNEELTALKSTASWKVTKPLRDLKSKLK